MPDIYTVYLQAAEPVEDVLTVFARQSFTVTMEGPPGRQGEQGDVGTQISVETDSDGETVLVIG